MLWIERFIPGLLEPERLDIWNTLGALLVVGGSVVCALSAPNVDAAHVFSEEDS